MFETTYRFALRPRWLLTHVLIVAVVVLMVGLGLWQLDRLDQRRDRNALVESRAALPTEPVGDLVDPGDGSDVTGGLRFRAVVATGTYDDEATVAVRSNQGGTPGAWVLTPMALPGGEEVVVLRGFAGTGRDGAVARPPAPAGDVVVRGLAVPVDRSERTVRNAVAELRGDRPGLLPVLVQAVTSDPAEDEALTPVPRPELDEGPHLSYAVQWFLFASVVAAGYPFLLRREARRRADRSDDDGTGTGTGAGAEAGGDGGAGD